MNIREAKEILGGDISNKNSKMNGYTFGISPFHCKTGNKLSAIEGTSCSKCYAQKIAKLRPNVAQAWLKRVKIINSLYTDSQWDNWVKAFNTLLSKRNVKQFRWHDSGDLQSLEHYSSIIRIAKDNPDISFWLPTKETNIVNSYTGEVPSNLVVRLSTPKIDSRPIKFINTSTVHKTKEHYGFKCVAPEQGNKCGSCNACYNKEVANVSYKLH